MNNIIYIKQLINELNYYRDEYYNKSNSVISDYEYDKKFDELKRLEEFTGVIMSNSPTQTVGYEVKSELKKVKHSHLMLSLNKTKTIEDLKEFCKEQESVIMCKLDGLTILLTYENGELIRAETRGNGEIGEDVTHTARMFTNIPVNIPIKERIEIEGEAIITYKDFDKINNALVEEKQYKHPRNLVSGSVRQLDSKITSERNVRFLAWKIPFDFLPEIKTMKERLIYANQLGFEVVPFYTINYLNLEKIEENINRLKKTSEEDSIPIDGMVITYNDIVYGESLGKTGHHPRHSLAYKFYDEEYTTTLVDIEWNTSKTGLINPVAIFEPVDLDGAITTRATLHNISYIENLQLGIGDKIQVYRANMVIPKVGNNLTKSDTWTLPTKCPMCQDKNLKVRSDNDSKTLWCLNPNCQGKLLGKLIHFVSKNAMDIKGFSEATIEKFVDLGWINSFEDIYKLSNFKDEMVKLEGFGMKSIKKLLESIENSKNVTLDKFIYAMSIQLIGSTASKDISKYCNGEISKFIQLMEEKFDFSNNINGFGSAMQESLEDWWSNNYLEFIQLSNQMNFIVDNKIEDSGSIVFNKVFVITGNLNYFKNRNELISYIEALGGKVSNSVSKNTDYLINNDVNSTSGKNKKAKQLSIPIITEEDFLFLL